MANSNGWGDGSANNNIGWGQGANNTIGWGKSHSLSWAGRTDIVGVTAGGNAPVNLVAPIVSGTNFYVGDVLTTTNGTWSGSPTSFTYQWYNVSLGDDIVGATNNTYTLLIANADMEINCKVFGTNAVGTGQGNSNIIATEFLFAPANVIEPELSTEGVNVGDTISILGNTWGGNPPPTLSYKWYRDGVHQNAHTASTYLTANHDSGKYIAVEVIGTNSQGSSSIFGVNECYVY
jgi:hypothetical protein